jgi:hypothetical protein
MRPMKYRMFKTFAYVSAILFWGFMGLSAYTWLGGPNPRTDESGIQWSYTSLGNLHVTVTSDWGGNLVFFNGEAPYTGSVVSLAGDKSVVERGLTGLGIYFRLIEYTSKNETWWTFMISLWYPVIILAILPAVLVVQKLRRQKPGSRREMAKA